MTIDKGYVPAGGETDPKRLADAIRQIIQNGAPDDVAYIVSAATGSLSAERVLTDTATVTWDFSVAGQAKATAIGGTTIDFFSANKNGANQSPTNGAWTKTTFTNEASDTGSFYDAANSRLTPPADSIVIITSAIYWTSTSAGDFGVLVYKNGAQSRGVIGTNPGGVSTWGALAAYVDVAGSGGTDYYEIYSFGVGASVRIDGFDSITYFCGLVIS